MATLPMLGFVVAWLALPWAAAAQERVDGATWTWGLEMSGAPAALARWEAARSGWIFGAGAGLGLGDEHVRVRATPTVRVGRALPAGFRIDGGLGFEWARLDRGHNDTESEIQWEITGGWNWASVLRAEAGVRWTDYRSRRQEGVMRLSLARSGSPAPTRDPVIPEALPLLGVPPTLTSRGLVHVVIDAPGRRGHGFVIAAANPRGDPAPGTTSGTGDNIDRLGAGLEAWSENGPWSTWLRWRSDLHTDPSIRARVQPIAEGLSFPVSVSFTGGARWRRPDSGSFGMAGRHDPQAFLWVPHLAAERTAAVSVLGADATHRDVALRVDALRLGRIAGLSIEPLGHTRIQAARGSGTVFGAEHERLTLGDRLVTRSRAVVEHTGPVFGRMAAGDDLALDIGARTTAGAWHGGARAGYRSRPELLDYGALLARGWLRDGGATESLGGAPVVDADLSAGRGPWTMQAAAFWGDPIWSGNGVRRGGGGYAHVTWTDTLASGRVEGRARVHLARWGTWFGWWREEPTLEGLGRIHLIDAALRLSGEVAARSALVSARSELEEPGGAELAVALTGPLPELGPLGGMLGQARLEDILDEGLPARIGAPLRGRRLILLVTLASGGAR